MRSLSRAFHRGVIFVVIASAALAVAVAAPECQDRRRAMGILRDLRSLAATWH